MEKNLHIGNEIRKELRKQDRSIAWLANKVDIDPSNLNQQLKSSNIRTKLLCDISLALKKDFFKFFSQQLLIHDISGEMYPEIG
jgi:hypothetical protein